MKKALLFLAIAALAFASCSSSDDDGIGNFDYDTELIYGTWEVTHADGFEWQYMTTTASFYPDGTYYGQGYFGDGNGTYKLSGKRVTCYVGGEKYMWYDVVHLNATTCELVANHQLGSITLTCKKQ